MATAPVALLDFTQIFVVETGACGKGIGAILMQEGKPIAYLSKALVAKNLGLSTYEKKFLALLLASYEVQYKKGNANRAADALSRLEYEKVEAHSNAITTQLPLWMQEVQVSYQGDTSSQTIIQAKTINAVPFPDYEYEVGILRRGGKIWVENNGGIREKVIKSLHDSALGGLPNSEGKDSILVVVDRLTKYSHFLAPKHLYTATSIANIFFDNIYKLHGLQVSIVTDKDKPYRQTSVSLLKQLKLSTKYFSPYKVIEEVGRVAYKLELPSGSKFHPAFHVLLLKKKIGAKYFSSENLPEFVEEVFKGQSSQEGERNIVFSSQNATIEESRPIGEINMSRLIEGAPGIGGKLKIATPDDTVLKELGLDQLEEGIGDFDSGNPSQIKPTMGHMDG
ncbi:UNVERIFIED_CONTAM: hypothetical protein Sradi_6812500 [Sesamum radiatum]|uniref:Uncharacterized protein n=1 Tax=Sesamum radiatum TaxID=300843 RepID=A0AAW2JSP0_SESRA